MKIYIHDKTNPNLSAFNIDNTYVSLKTIAHILSGISGVTLVKKRKLFSQWEYVHIWFKYKGYNFVVYEPYGDSSLYVIGPEESCDIDIKPIQIAFELHSVSVWRRVVVSGIYLCLIGIWLCTIISFLLN
ncbi:hypothetical protein VQ643_16025 [Pseudomonas sp. F1_0610]|uniref:hypothetical protein n=1 Tax=Pseudomonas sp. F1_0610 TaxID=3114284 RepID=UPI0039C082F0